MQKTLLFCSSVSRVVIGIPVALQHTMCSVYSLRSTENAYSTVRESFWKFNSNIKVLTFTKFSASWMEQYNWTVLSAITVNCKRVMQKERTKLHCENKENDNSHCIYKSILLICAKRHTWVECANLEETLLIKEPANIWDNPRPCDKITADIVVHQQIQISLPKTCFLSSATMATITSVTSFIISEYHSWQNTIFFLQKIFIHH